MQNKFGRLDFQLYFYGTIIRQTIFKTKNKKMKKHQVSKLRVVTRRDLTLSQQAVQSAHAAIDFQHQYPTESLEWNQQSNYLVFLTVEDESALKLLEDKCLRLGIKYTTFIEPDLNNELTAICLDPTDEQSVKITSSMPLLGKVKEVCYA